jgi:hypothetical protein
MSSFVRWELGATVLPSIKTVTVCWKCMLDHKYRFMGITLAHICINVSNMGYTNTHIYDIISTLRIWGIITIILYITFDYEKKES